MASPLLYPAVGGAPGSTVSREPAQAPDRATNGGAAPRPAGGTGRKEEFGDILGKELLDKGFVRAPLKFSAHASARVQSRKLNMGPEQMRSLNEAVDKAAAKGLDDALILTKDAAFIVNVSNRTVVTAMDRAALEGNVFTNIDGAVIA